MIVDLSNGATDTTTLRVLSVNQPHATALVHPDHPKTIETRGRDLKIRGWVLIYATKSVAYPDLITDGVWHYTPKVVTNRIRGTHRPAVLRQTHRTPVELPRAAIVGAVRIVDSVPIRQVWMSQEGIEPGAGVVVVHERRSAELIYRDDARTTLDITDQFRWGDYDTDVDRERWAWLTDARMMFPTPIPALAPHQGWWTATIPADEWGPSTVTHPRRTVDHVTDGSTK